MRPDDLYLLRVPDAPALAPDGSAALVAVRRMDRDADEYRSRLWLVPTAGGSPRPFTQGAQDSAPAWSPDGRSIAFLRAQPGEKGPVGKPQLHVMAADGGEPLRLTEHPLGVSELAWRPDSGALAYVARVPEDGRYGTVEGRTPDKEPPRRITTLNYRRDNIGFTLDRRAHIFLLPVPELADAGDRPEPRQLTDGDHDDSAVTWSPDGQSVAFVSSRHDSHDSDLVSDVYAVPATGGAPRRVTAGGLSVGRPTYTADGATIRFLGAELGASCVDGAGRNVGLWSVPADGAAPPTRLTPTEPVHLADGQGGPLSQAGDAVLTGMESRGAVELVAIAPDGSLRTLLGGQRQLRGLATAAGTVVATVSTPESPGELVLLRDGEERVLTDFGAELAASAEALPMQELAATAPDGYPVHGWLVRPEGDGPHPVLLLIHGGPFTQYGWTLFDEAQVYARAGYAVVMGNPRGASGYGERHGRAIIGAMGQDDAADLLALLDAGLAEPGLDADRVGVMGGSYGGFMTTWLLAQQGDRFRAGIAERAVTAWDSFTGSSDIGWFFTRIYTGDDPERTRAQDPLAHAHQISKPTLIIHSEHDWRCPVEQAQRLFVALKLQGTEAELLLFPGEGHEMSRSGLPSHRVARFEAILGWWDRHLAVSR